MSNSAAMAFRREPGENSRRRCTKARNYRVRKKHGLAVLKITVLEYDCIEFLIETGRLSIAQALDRREVERACSEALGELVTRWR